MSRPSPVVYIKSEPKSHPHQKLRIGSMSSEGRTATTPSSAGTPSTKVASKRVAKRLSSNRVESSEDEYSPAKDGQKKVRAIRIDDCNIVEQSYQRRERLAPYPPPVRKPGYFKTAYKCFECARDGQDCFVPDKENVGACLYGPCQRGGLARCHGHQRVNISEAMKKDPAAMLRHRIRLVLKKVANEGHKMSSTGEYLEWTPFPSSHISLEKSRQKWAKMAVKEDPTLEHDVDDYLARQVEEDQSTDEVIDDTDKDKEEEVKVRTKGPKNVAEAVSELDESSVDDPLQGIIKDVMPKRASELQKYLASLKKAEESLSSQMEVVRATVVQVKYKLSRAK